MGDTRIINAEQFEKEVLGGDLPALVDFTATWCGPCQALAPAIDELAREYDGRALVAKVDVDKEPDLAARYGVMSVPTVLFFKGGEKVDQVMGNFPDKIKKSLEALL